MGHRFVSAGALLAALAVAAGAFGAHALRDAVTPERLDVFETASRYHLVHAVGLVLLGMLIVRQTSTLLVSAAWAMILGIALFSGSLYALVMLDKAWLGAITPLGGVCFISAWAMLAVWAWKRAQSGR
jgi:uncharacterized membrane protein YgdD (TMEM256/DUF423 family)